MFGDNPIRPPKKGDGDLLDVKNIFATFQGEGIYTGWPAVFVRLGGCNLACDFCDTDFEDYKEISLPDILEKINELSGKKSGNFTHKLIVITGGEPLRQPIEKLCEKLIISGYKVQIETNGTLFRDLDKNVDIICSPKNTGNGYSSIRDDLLQRLNAIKFIVSAHNPLYKNVANIGQNTYNTPVYIQPMDECDAKKNKQNTILALKIASENGYRISVQTHKVLEIE